MTSPEQIPTLLRRMNQALTHRGPDDEGQYCNQGCGIAMRRLSIIDVSGGHQPIFNEDGQISVVLNGEIYNFQELRNALALQGHRFQTHSDTEVLVHLYEDVAEAMPERLKGMFAFCIYDRKDHSLLIARDRFGEKPLFYYNHPQEGFVFSSEIKSLLECPFVPRQLNCEAMGYYMRTGYVPTPLTMFKDIYILPPGNWLKWRAGELTIRPYYETDYSPDPTLDRESDAIDAVREHLRQAVKRQMISDVPLGAFLSGGIDSSAIVANLQAISSQPIKTFTMRFEDQSFDEGEIARNVAEHLGTEHHEFVVQNLGFSPDDFWRIVEHVGLPFADTSAIPTYIISKHIRQMVTVALSGDGGDEMFAGYSVFQWGNRINQLQTLPRPLLRSGAWLTNWLSQQRTIGNISGLRQIRRGLQAASAAHHLLPVEIHALFEPVELASLLLNKKVMAVATGDLPLVTDLPSQATSWSPLRKLMYFRLKHMLNDQMLTKVDRMSMAASLEVRAPMLDVDLAALSMRLPDKHLIKNGVGKYVLRKAIQGKVPDIVFNHPKTGFSIPLHRFQNAQYKSLAHELLNDREGIMQMFSPEAVSETIHIGLDRQSDRADRSVYRTSHQLWAMMQLAAWQKRFKVSI